MVGGRGRLGADTTFLHVADDLVRHLGEHFFRQVGLALVQVTMAVNEIAEGDKLQKR